MNYGRFCESCGAMKNDENVMVREEQMNMHTNFLYLHDVCLVLSSHGRDWSNVWGANEVCVSIQNKNG